MIQIFETFPTSVQQTTEQQNKNMCIIIIDCFVINKTNWWRFFWTLDISVSDWVCCCWLGGYWSETIMVISIWFWWMIGQMMRLNFWMLDKWRLYFSNQTIGELVDTGIDITLIVTLSKGVTHCSSSSPVTRWHEACLVLTGRSSWRGWWTVTLLMIPASTTANSPCSPRTAQTKMYVCFLYFYIYIWYGLLFLITDWKTGETLMPKRPKVLKWQTVIQPWSYRCEVYTTHSLPSWASAQWSVSLMLIPKCPLQK